MKIIYFGDTARILMARCKDTIEIAAQESLLFESIRKNDFAAGTVSSL
jgi:hypothetical protein